MLHFENCDISSNEARLSNIAVGHNNLLVEYPCYTL